MANVLTFVEVADDRATWGSLLALRLGRDLASRFGATLYAVLPCSSPPLYGDDDIIAELSRQGADKVILMTHLALVSPARFSAHGEALLSALHQFPPSVLLFPSGAAAEDIAPRIAARIGADYAHLPRFEGDPVSPDDVTVVQPLLGGQASHRFRLGERATPLVATVSPDPQTHGRPRGSEEAEVVVISPRFPKSAPPPEPAAQERSPGRPTADRMVLLGADAKDAAVYPLAERLAERLGAELFCTEAGLPPDAADVEPRVLAPPLDASTIRFVLGVGVSASEWEAIRPPETVYVVGLHPDRATLDQGAVHLALHHPLPEALEQMLEAAGPRRSRTAPGVSDPAIPSEQSGGGSEEATSGVRRTLGAADTLKMPVAAAGAPQSPASPESPATSALARDPDAPPPDKKP